MVKILKAVSRKRLRESLSLEDAKKARRDMMAIRREDLVDPDKVTKLPFPGLLHPGSRPGLDIDFVGVPDLQALFDEWDDSGDIICVGAIGLGKSCCLRALTCVKFAAGCRLVCIWNMERARRDLCLWLVHALLFTFCLDGAAVLAEIEDIQDLDGVEAFLKERKAMGEEFTFVIDGAQALDVKHWYGTTKVDAVQRRTDHDKITRFLTGSRVVWGLSPRSDVVENFEVKQQDDTVVVYLDQGFVDKAKNRVLGRLITDLVKDSSIRKEQVEYYCGSHPLSLAAFETSCYRVAMDKLGGGWDDLQAADIVELLADDEDWEAVLEEFLCNPNVRCISNSLGRHLNVVSGPCYDLAAMACQDPRYALDKEQGVFCTRYIQQVYIEHFRAKEQQLLKQVAGPWVDYCKLVLRQPVVNWAEVGWLCERLCCDVVSRRGLSIGERFNISDLMLKPFSSIPKLAPDAIGPGLGFIYLPVMFNFGKVDAVIVYRDMNRHPHFIGLQFTTSLEKHRHSEDEFMSVAEMESWIPDVLLKVRAKAWTLHYAFVCLTSQLSEEKPENVAHLRSRVPYGILAHWLHVCSFDEVLRNRVSNDVLDTLKAMAAKRELEYSATPGTAPFPPAPSSPQPGGPLVTSRSQLKKLKRAGLDALAVAGGVDPKTYRNMDLLIDAMVSAGLVHV